MSDDLFRSRTPVSRVATERLTRWVDLDGTGSRTLVPFEREVAWVRETETKVILRNDIQDQELQGFGAFNDYYGYLSSVAGALEEIKWIIKSYGLNACSFLRLDVMLSVVEVPVVPLVPGEPLEFGRFKYKPCPKDWMIADLVPAWESATFEQRGSSVPSPTLSGSNILKEAVWTSRWLDKTPKEQIDLSYQVLDKVVDGTPSDTLRSGVEACINKLAGI